MENADLKAMPDILGMALYESINLSDYSYQQLFQLIAYHDENINDFSISSVDSYCNQCSKDTTFKSRNSSDNVLNSIHNLIMRLTETRYGDFPFDSVAFYKHLEEIEIFSRSFYCPRSINDKAHDISIIFRVSDRKITKIGQFPPLAEIQSSHLKRYKELDNEIYKELNRAVGLNTYGIGVGSFVYLRRIIEKHILYPEIQILQSEGVITTEQIKAADFKTKIHLVKDKLPQLLVENTHIYSILSKGIHSLSENECLQIFNPLLTAIELILDERLEEIQRKRKRKQMLEDLKKIT